MKTYMVVQTAEIVAVPALTRFTLRETSFLQSLSTCLVLVPLLDAFAVHLLIEFFADLTQVVRHHGEGGCVKRELPFDQSYKIDITIKK